jgi:hypothetical protein
VRNVSVTTTTFQACLYSRDATRSSKRYGSEPFAQTPTASNDSGQRSRTSNTNRARCRRAIEAAATGQSNCGEVPITTSGRKPSPLPRTAADSMKLP